MRFDPKADRELLAAFHRPTPCAEEPVAALWPRARNPAMQVLRAVLRLAGAQAELIRHAERPWASVTFAGARHTIVLGFEGVSGIAAGEAFVAALGEHEFAIRGHLVADATVAAMAQEALPHPRMVVEAELLLLEDC